MTHVNIGIQTTIVSLERINVLLQKVDENKNSNIFKGLKSCIHFNQVTYGYDDNEKYVFSNLNLSIAQNQFIGIVGENGSGKSTFIKLLTGELIPTFGAVLYDNVPIEIFEKNLSTTTYQL